MKERRRLPLHTKILIGLVIGAAAGAICQAVFGHDNPRLDDFAKGYAFPFGKLFIRMIFMVVVPLLFSALTLGVMEMGEGHRIGRVGVRALGMTVVLSGLAVLLGMLLFNLFQPGSEISPEERDALVAAYADEKKAEESVAEAEKRKTVPEMLLEIVPDNPIVEANRALQGGLLPLMFFALVFGIAMSAVAGSAAVMTVKSFLEGLFAISLKMIEFAMRLAPYGVAALLFYTTYMLGLDAIKAVGKYVLIVLLGLAIHQFVTYSLVLKFVAKRNPLQFFKQITEVMLTAFATSSSNATLPTALRVSQQEVKLPKDISNFVLTVGATGNQNGTALFEGITVLFLCTLFGAQLSLADQAAIMGLAIVAGIGTAGVPGGAWPMIAVILAMYQVNPLAIGLVLGIDRIMDMSRTVLNVTGDITIAACVTRMEQSSEAKAAPA